MSSIIEWRVYSKPETQGSMTSYPFRRKNGRFGVNTVHPKKLLEWRKEVAKTYHEEYPEHSKGELIFEKGVPVEVELEIHVPKPKSNKDDLPVNTRTGDIDKYIRGVLDACTGIIYYDDCQVVNATSKKRYVPEDECGATIRFKRFVSD